MRRAAVVIVALALVACAAPEKAPPKPGIISFDFEDLDLRDAVATIGSMVGKKIVVDPLVNERLTISLYDIPWRDAVDVIARMTRCEVLERGDGLVLEQPCCFTRISFTNSDLRTVLQLVASYSGKNIVLAPDVHGRITIDMREVSWDDLLPAIVRACRLNARTSGDIISIARKPLEEGFALPPGGRELAEEGGKERLGKIRAQDAPLPEWFALLASVSGRALVVDCDRVVGTTSQEFADVPFRDALRTAARSCGYHVIEDPGHICRLEASPRAPLRAPAPPRSTLVALPDGRKVPARLQGVVIGAGDVKSRALLGGRVYEVGDPLTDDDGKEIAGVRVAAIDDEGVSLDVATTRARLAFDQR